MSSPYPVSIDEMMNNRLRLSENLQIQLHKRVMETTLEIVP